jgi:hypothetical protein
MKVLGFRRGAMSAFVAVAMLVGCGGSQTPMGFPNNTETSVLKRNLSQAVATSDSRPTERIADTPDYEASGSLLFVTNSDGYNTAVTIYDAAINDPSPIAAITEDLLDPFGDCIDGDGTLYVTNEPSSGLGWVSEYALGKTKPLRRITEGIDIPGYCAIDGQENLWVANVGGPTVTEYLKGSTKPHTILKNGLTYPNSVAIDHAGNIYVGNVEPYGTSNVQVFAPGSKSPSRTITDGVTWPEGIAVDANGALYVPNYLQCDIEEYLAGKSKPYRTITGDLNAPVDVTFAKNGWMYELNVGNQDCSGPAPVILEFRPGSIKPSSRMISKELHGPEGIAYYPPELP